MTVPVPGLLIGAAIVAAMVDLAAFASPEQFNALSRGEPHEFLRTMAGFTATELASLDRGEPIAKVLDTDKREVALAGAVRVKAPRGRLFDQYRNVSGLRRSEVFLQVSTFSAIPRAEDLRALTFEDYDLDTIRACRPGDCGVRLPADSLTRFQHEVDWRAADWRQQAASLWRRLLADYAAGYLVGGSKALAEYQNKEVPLSVAQEFNVLFEESRYFRPAAPEFFRYLEEFPTVPLDGVETILYWDKANFGLRPVISLTHLTLYAPVALSPSSGPSPGALVATKQIYATHYFDAALGLTLVFDDDASGFYMLCINRARTRSLTSFVRGFVRGIVQRRSRDAMDKILRTTKRTLEQVG